MSSLVVICISLSSQPNFNPLSDEGHTCCTICKDINVIFKICAFKDSIYVLVTITSH